MRILALFTLLLGLAPFSLAHADEPKPLSIQRITPEGDDVPAGRQIVFEFNRAVVPLGRMDRTKDEIPVTITPDPNCEWRWLNVTTLSCNLGDNNALKESTKYTVEFKPGLRAEDGATLDAIRTHSFVTQRANVSYPSFRNWLSPSMPVIMLVLNQPVTKESLQQHLFIQAGDQRVPMVIDADPNDSTPPAIVPLPGEKMALVTNAQPRKPDDQKQTVKGQEARRIWLVKPVRELPLDSNAILKIEPGLVSAIGTELSDATRDVVQFDTYPEFKFLGIICQTNANKEALITPENAAKNSDMCDPMSPVNLSFSTPVFRSQVRDNITVLPTVAPEAWGDLSQEYSRLSSPHQKGRTYNIWLPGGLKAAAQYHIASKEPALNLWEKFLQWVKALFGAAQPVSDLSDEFGRKLMVPFDITFKTDHRKPNYELLHHNAVLEKGVDSEVPLYVNNLKNIQFNFSRLTASGSDKTQVSKQDVPQVQDIQFAIPFGVRNMLKGKSGAIYGTLTTDPLVDTSDWNRLLFAVVSPYEMHVKLGHFSTLVWLTDFATGQPVADAKVTIYKDSLVELNGGKGIADAVTDANGVAMLPGTSVIDPSLAFSNVWKDTDTRLFMRAEKSGELAVMPLSQEFLIDTYRASDENVYHYNRRQYGHIHSWGTTAQGIYRVGDTIQYKLYVRDQNDLAFVAAPKGDYKLEILDPTGQTVQEIKSLTLSDFGAYDGEFTLPKQSAVGWYEFRLTGSFGKKPEDEGSSEDGESPDDTKVWTPMRVLVSDFTPSPFKVDNELNGDLFHAGDPLEIATNATLHSGGAYTEAGLRITAMLESRGFSSKNKLAEGFYFASYENEQNYAQIFQKMTTLDMHGQQKEKFTLPKHPIVYGELIVESAVQDDRGKYVASSARAHYVGVDRLVGLKSRGWLYHAGEKSAVDYLVVDEKGNPAPGTKVDLLLEHQVSKAARVKGAGNAYLTEYKTEWVKEGECHGTSTDAPLSCDVTPKESGTYRLTASITDTQGNPHSTNLTLWSVGKDYVLWNNDEDNIYLPLEPEKAEYHVGDTARYLVKNPYPGAKALITIERYGIIDHFVQTLEGSTPVIEFPIKPDYIPGFYLSVTVMSPRVDKPLEAGQVDLGKPAYRMGYARVPVIDPAKEMLVTANADREVYKPREKVTLSLHAEPRLKNQQEPIEFAVAVLDESVFALLSSGRLNYDPYKGFYTLDDLDLRNFSLLTRLIGRQKFEKKGANPGGDGGADLSMRTLFKFVSYWNPALKADKNGNASATFEVPDNLTGWRILAMAVTPTDRFGLGDANFKVNRPTELRPVMPNQVTENDTFNAGFNLMNRTDKKRTIKVTLAAEGHLAEGQPLTKEQSVTLEPYQRTTVAMMLKASRLPMSASLEKGEIRFTARAEDEIDSDAITHSLPVNKAKALETAATYGTTTDDKITQSILFPDKIRSDMGDVSVVLSPSVIANVQGAFDYMRSYPYMCWEQRLTKGVMASHYQALKAYMPDSFIWKGSDTLADETLKEAVNFQAPNGGMSYFMPSDDYADPYLSAYTALAFQWLRAEGHTIPTEVENKLHGYLRDLLKQNTMPSFYNEGMSSTVRAVALAALAPQGKVDKSDLERYQPHLKQMSLFGQAHYALAARQVKGAGQLADEAQNMILAKSSESGGKFSFNETLDDGYLRILATPLRDNCAVLDSFVTQAESEQGKKLAGDVPFKLVRTITQSRKNRDHWENTQENMFCMNALAHYSRIYEATKPKMNITATLDETPFGKAKFSDLRDAPVTLSRTILPEDPGRKAMLGIAREGDGRLYYAARLRYSPLEVNAAGANAGIDLKREYSVDRNGKWELLKFPATIRQGELVRVDLYLSLPTARNFVVVEDPVPGGLEPVNRDLATTSEVDAKKGDYAAAGGSWWFKFADWSEYNVSRWSFYHQELRHDVVRYYSDYLSPGNYHLSYTAQAIAQGKFLVMPSMAEEMYDPDIFGKAVGGELVVKEAEK